MENANAAGKMSALAAAEADVARLEADLATARAAGDRATRRAAERALKRGRRALARARRADARAAKAIAKKDARAARERSKNPGAGIEPPVKGAKLVEPRDSTKRVLAYEQLHEDGVMRVAKGCYSIALDVDDVNFIGCRPEEQAFVVYCWRSYLDGLDHELSLQVCLKTRAIDEDVFYDSIALRPVSGDERGNELREEYNAWIREQMGSSSRSMRRTRTVVISVEADTYREAVPTLMHESERFIRFMRDLGSDARLMDGQQRLDDLCSYTRQDDAAGTQRFEAVRESLGLTTLDLAAPTRIVRVEDGRGDARMIVGRRWVKTYSLQLDGYGKTMHDSFIADISSLPYDISISWHVRPWETAAAISAAEAHYNAITEENNAFKLNRSRPDRGYFVDDDNLPPAMLTAQREAAAFRDALTGEGKADADPDRAFGVTTVVSVMGRDEAELTEACRAVEKAFQEHRKPIPDAWSAMREQAFSTVLPTGSCLVPYDRTLNSEPLSRMLMFASAEVFDDGGLLLGVNADTRSFIVYNATLHEHTNSFVLAAPRSGKSFNVKQTRLMQNHLIHPEDDVIGIDPEGELTETVLAAGGQVVDISETSADHVNPLDISLNYDALDPTKSADPVPAKVSFLQTLIHMMSGSVTDEMVNIVDRAGKYIYADWCENPCDENVPTLQDLYDYLRDPEIASPASMELSNLIERYVQGTLGVFNHHTTVHLDRNLVAFNISNLSDTLKPIALLVILEHIWVRVTANRRRGRRTWLIVDEFQLLLNDEYAVDQFDRFFSRGGKWDLYITAITQNVERVLANEKTYMMLQNSPFITLLAQSNASAKVLQELLELSDAQTKTLTTARKGEGLYWFKNKVIHFDFRMSPKTCPRLCDLFSTTPEEIKRRRQRQMAEAVQRRADEAAADVRAKRTVKTVPAPEAVEAPVPAPDEAAGESTVLPGLPVFGAQADLSDGPAAEPVEHEEPAPVPAPVEPTVQATAPAPAAEPVREPDAADVLPGLPVFGAQATPAAPATVEPAPAPAPETPRRGGVLSAFRRRDKKEKASAKPEPRARRANVPAGIGDAESRAVESYEQLSGESASSVMAGAERARGIEPEQPSGMTEAAVRCGYVAAPEGTEGTLE